MASSTTSGALERGSGTGTSALVAGKYRLFATLGRGGMAEVFLGVALGSLGINKLVVVKRMRDQFSDDSLVVSMFLDEGRLATRLNHPNVIHTYEIGEEAGTYFIAMEYLEGQAVSEIARKALSGDTQHVDPRVWVRIIADALSGLHYAHDLKDYDGQAMNVVHRDVSPQNLFVTYDGRVKLVDFGIAKAALNATHTETGILKGKLTYMSPEQATGIALDRRSDIYSMGVVLWELLTGKRLVTGDAAVALNKVLNAPVRRVSELVPTIDPELDAIVTRAVAKERDERYPSALEMRAALETYLRRSGTTPIEETQLGELVSGMFRDERKEIHARIKHEMARVSATSTRDLVSLTTGVHSSPGSGGTRSAVSSGAHRAVEDTTDTASTLSTDAGARRGRMITVVAIGAAVIVAAIVLFVVRPGSRAVTADTTSRTSQPAPAEVEVAFTASPPEAIISIDDARLPGNPHKGKFAKDERSHVVRVEAPGFTPKSQIITFERDMTVNVALSPEAPAQGASAAASASAAPTATVKGPLRPPPHAPRPPASSGLEADPWKK
jgi:serine/threonine-protein kinase